MLLVKIINLNYSIELFYIYDKIINTNAGIVQRLECGLAKAKMSVRFRLLAPIEYKQLTKLLFLCKVYNSIVLIIIKIC